MLRASRGQGPFKGLKIQGFRGLRGSEFRGFRASGFGGFGGLGAPSLGFRDVAEEILTPSL